MASYSPTLLKIDYPILYSRQTSQSTSNLLQKITASVIQLRSNNFGKSIQDDRHRANQADHPRIPRTPGRKGGPVQRGDGIRVETPSRAPQDVPDLGKLQRRSVPLPRGQGSRQDRVRRTDVRPRSDADLEVVLRRDLRNDRFQGFRNLQGVESSRGDALLPHANGAAAQVTSERATLQQTNEKSSQKQVNKRSDRK